MYERAATDKDIARLLRSYSPIVVIADRGVGKTTELIKFAEEKNPNGKFAIVCFDNSLNDRIIKMHYNIFNRLSQTDIVAKRLLGEEIEGHDVSEPIILNDSHVCSSVFFKQIGEKHIPVFVDEWYSLSETARRSIAKMQLFIAAVSS